MFDIDNDPTTITIKDDNGKVTSIIFIPNNIKSSEIQVQLIESNELKDKVNKLDESQLLSSTINIEVKKGISINQPIKLCFLVNKKSIPQSVLSPKQPTQPDGGCQTVSISIYILN